VVDFLLVSIRKRMNLSQTIVVDFLLVSDVAVKSVDGSQSSRELEDLQETRE
jgi:hypothetical protein